MKLGRFAVILLIVALLCASALGRSNTKRGDRKRNHLKERAVPIIPVEEKTEVNPDVAVIYSVSPTLIPVGFNNYTLTVYTSTYLYNLELCCVFGTLGSVVTNATTTSYYAYCPIPQVTFRTYEQAYLAQCSDLTVPYSTTFYVSFYSGLPQISDVIIPSVLSAVGGQNITVTLSNLPLVSSYDDLAFSAKFLNSYVSLTGEVNGDGSFTFSTLSLPIGSTSFTVNVYLNNSYITTAPYPVTIHSVRIEDFTPTSACSIGNSAVDLTLNAQVPQSPYLPLCQFTADYYGDDADETPKVVTTLAAYNASGQLTCLTPAWSASTTLATLQLIDPYERTVISNPVSFSFYTDCINQLDTPNVCIIGGFPVYVSGTGLPSGNYYYSYAYVYADANLTTLITSNTFNYINSTTGYYLPGTAEYNYATTYVQIGTYYTKYSPVFEVSHTNSCLTSVYPKSFSIDGGDTITLEIVGQFYNGYSSYSYTCLFIDPENYHISQPATVASNTTITCVTPPVSESGYGSVALSAAAYPTAHASSSISVHYT